MIHVCSWCTAYLGTVEPLADLRTTHGICEPCAAKIAPKPELAPLVDRLHGEGCSCPIHRPDLYPKEPK